MTGLRPPADAAGLLRALAVDLFAPLAAELERAASPRALRGVLSSILEWPQAGRKELVDRVVGACERLASTDGPYAGAATAAVREALHHPGDLGVVALLLMRHTVLEPAEAVFMPAGGLHAYLRGTGIELLANSDNVVRAGLTSKHVDVPELLKLLDPAVAVPVLSSVPLAGGVRRFDTPAPEFCLYLADLAEHAVILPGAGPRIVLCIAGTALLRGESGQAVKLARGDSCFVSAADGPLHASGPAYLFLATPGSPA